MKFDMKEVSVENFDPMENRLVDDAWMTGGEKQVYERALNIVPRLKANNEQCEALRRLPDESFQLLQECGLPRIMQPRLYGGLEGSTVLLSRIVEELTQACPSTAWVLAVYGEHAWFTASFGKEAQDDVWLKNPQAVVASSLAPRATAENVEGGFRLTGTFPFASGCRHADWIILGAFVKNETASEMRYMLVPMSEVKILDDWNTLGLRGTGSSTVALDGVFIPEYRTLVDRCIQRGETPGSQLHKDFAILRAPRQAFSTFTQLPVTLGLARRVLSHTCSNLRGRVSRGVTNLQDSQLVQLKIGEASTDAAAAILVAHQRHIYTDAKLRRGETVSKNDVLLCRRDSVWANQLARKSIEKLVSVSSAEIVHDRNALQAWLRDSLTTGVHFSANWDNAMVPFGKYQLGLAV